MRRSTLLYLVASLALLAACDTEKVEVMKSPCAGIDGSPCGPKRLMNGPLNHYVLPDRA